jgi:hypothetical protein
VFVALVRIRVVVRVAQGQVPCEGRGCRHGLPGGLAGTNALPDERAVVDDANATQHQVFQLQLSHGRPPAIKKEKQS